MATRSDAGPVEAGKQPQPPRAGGVPAAADEEELLGGVRSVLGELGVPVAPDEVSITRIPGGASRETWLVSAGGGSPRFVLRRDPPAGSSPASTRLEFGLMQLTAEAGVPVPQPRHFEPAGARFGSAGMLMEHVAGESIAPRILRRAEYGRARELLPDQLAAALARIHRVDVERAAELIGAPEDRDPALAELSRWEAELSRLGEPLPVLEAGLRWLRANRPAPRGSALVHGDFRLGNLIVDGSGLAAVIDWELAHIGDPAEDVGWLCVRSWRFGADRNRLAGLGELEPFLRQYERAGGSPIDSERVRYWEAFGNLKWAVICARQADDHRSGRRVSHELAALGRRICEPEWDLLELVGGGA